MSSLILDRPMSFFAFSPYLRLKGTASVSSGFHHPLLMVKIIHKRIQLVSNNLEIGRKNRVGILWFFFSSCRFILMKRFFHTDHDIHRLKSGFCVPSSKSPHLVFPSFCCFSYARKGINLFYHFYFMDSMIYIPIHGQNKLPVFWKR